MDAMTKGELVKFVGMMTTKGWVNPNTGAGYKSALSKILADVPAEEDVRKIDVRTQVLRYNNLHQGELNPASLKQYEKRITQVIGHFVRYKTDPTNFKAPQRGLPNSGKAESEKPKPKAKKSAARKTTPPPPPPPANPEAPPKPATGSATETNLVLPFPLRSDYLAQVVIPRNMTMDEAERLCSFIKSLAQAAK
jgi:hypothetical protein